MMKRGSIIPVILSGGSGTRLWPLSRAAKPKQFLNLMGDHSLFQATVLRALDVTGVPDSDLVIVTRDSMRDETLRQLEAMGAGGNSHILFEPMARCTAAAVALAAHYVRRTFGDDVLVWLMPADGYIGREAALVHALNHAAAAAREGRIIAFGVNPARPETGYGYIGCGPALAQEGVYGVSRFIEKPGAERARALCKDGNTLWNTGMYVFCPVALLGEYERYAADTAGRAFSALESATADGRRACPAFYEGIRAEPFEKAVLEKSERVAVVPCELDWSDVGSWESLWLAGEKDENGNVATGNVVSHTTDDSLIYSQDGRLVACIGLKDVIVVDAGDIVMVADKNNAGAIKTVVRELQKKQDQESPGPQSSHLRIVNRVAAE